VGAGEGDESIARHAGGAFVAQDVYRRASEPAGTEGVQQRRLVDQFAAGGVDKPGARLHAPKLLAAEEPPGLGREAHVQGHGVRLPQQLGQRDKPHPGLDSPGVNMRVRGEDLCFEGAQVAGHDPADAPVPHDADAPAVELMPFEQIPVPAPVCGVRRGGRQVPEEGQHQGQRVFGGRPDVLQELRLTLQGEHLHATPVCVLHIDMVEAGRGRDDDPEERRRREHLGVDVVAEAYPENVRLSDGGEQTGPVEIGQRQVTDPPQPVRRMFGEPGRFRNENPGSQNVIRFSIRKGTWASRSAIRAPARPSP